MEAFSLLKYWRGGGGGLAPSPAPPTADTTHSATTSTPNAAATTAILTAVAQNDIETDDDNDGDDGPFFDLEFTVPDDADDSEDARETPSSGSNSVHHSEENEEEEEEEEDDDDNNEGSEREFKFTLSPSSNERSDDPNLSLSPSDDLFFKGKLVQLEPSSFVLNPSEPNSKPQFTASLLKSATKFRVFMLGLKKSKSNVVASSDKESNGSDSVAPNPKQQQQCQQPEPLKKQQEPQQRKLFTVKFKVEEVPIVSLFTRDNSSRGGGGGASANKASQNQKQNTEESQTQTQTQSPSSASDEKRFSKEVMQKYLKMVKPLYIRVSRRYAEKLRFSGQLNVSSSSGSGKAAPQLAAAAQKPAPAKAVAEKAQMEEGASESLGTNMKGQKQGNLPLPSGLRVVCKHLGKSRSASSAAVAVASTPAPEGLVSSRRRDDSLLQQQDGIQGAILHCKRSFNASRECESSQLPRSVSDPLHEISPELSRKSTNEGKNKRL